MFLNYDKHFKIRTTLVKPLEALLTSKLTFRQSVSHLVKRARYKKKIHMEKNVHHTSYYNYLIDKLNDRFLILVLQKRL